MNNPDFRVLVAELVASIDRINGGSMPSVLPPAWDALDRARAALAAPIPDPIFRAVIRPDLSREAQALVAAYERTPGSTGPGCCPEALAAVLGMVAEDAARVIGLCGSISVIELLRMKAKLLRGK
jgi:hypothetical protein